RARSSCPSSAVTPTIWPGCTFAPTTTASSASCLRSASFIASAYASWDRLRREVPAHGGDQPGRRERCRCVSRGPLAARQIEVAVEVARLLQRPRRPEHETVRLQQRADV